MAVKWIYIFTICFLVLCMIICYISKYDYTGIPVVSNQRYALFDQTLYIPSMDIHGSATLLKHSFRKAQLLLLRDVTTLLRHLHIVYWASGGTLLGLTRHRTLMPWDDDCDIHCSVKYRVFMFSTRFQQICRAYGLERIIFVFSNVHVATREGACVRIRHIGTKLPICDIFFVKRRGFKMYKINGWYRGKFRYSKLESWSIHDIFPLQTQRLHMFNINVPRNPVNVLQAQYGPNCMTSIYTRPTILSHRLPFVAFPYVWRT